MNKWYGAVGYAELIETSPDVWEEEITERMYSGDVQRLGRRLQQEQSVNDGIAITNQLSILADPYAYSHFQNIRYVTVWGSKWKITNIDVQYPRLVFTLGEEYHDGEK